MVDFIKGMFANLNWSFPKEPVLWMAFIVAVLNIAISVINGDISWIEAIETFAIAFGAFVARGASTPTADPKLNDGTPLAPKSPI